MRAGFLLMTVPPTKVTFANSLLDEPNSLTVIGQRFDSRGATMTA